MDNKLLIMFKEVFQRVITENLVYLFSFRLYIHLFAMKELMFASF